MNKNDEFNKVANKSVAQGCGCFAAFIGICIAVFVACWGTPKDQFISTLSILILILGGGAFVITYFVTYAISSSSPSIDLDNLYCDHCHQKIVPPEQRQPASSVNAKRCPFCKQFINPSTSDTTEESNPEKTSPERDA